MSTRYQIYDKSGSYFLQHNIYDASGERVLKGVGFETSISINGEPVGTGFSIGNYTTYASGDFVVDGNRQVSKHYFMGSERIASRLTGLYDPNNEVNCQTQDKHIDQWISNEFQTCASKGCLGTSYKLAPAKVLIANFRQDA